VYFASTYLLILCKFGYHLVCFVTVHVIPLRVSSGVDLPAQVKRQPLDEVDIHGPPALK